MGNHVISVRAESGATPLTRVTARQHEFTIDEPALFGGEDTAPSPVEYLLGAVAGCITAIGCQMAKEAGFQVYGLRASVDGEIDSARFLGLPGGTRSGFQEIRIGLEIDCSATEEQLRGWQEQLALRCPVLDGLLHPAKVKIDCERKRQ